MFICLFPGSRVTTNQRVVAKQEIQEVESAKRAGAPYAHHRYQARDTNTKRVEEFKNRIGIYFARQVSNPFRPVIMGSRFEAALLPLFQENLLTK